MEYNITRFHACLQFIQCAFLLVSVKYLFTQAEHALKVVSFGQNPHSIRHLANLLNFSQHIEHSFIYLL